MLSEEIISINRMKLFARSNDLSVVTAKDMNIVINLVENLQKEIECDNLILKRLIKIKDRQSKEIEELKEDRKKYAEEYIHNNPWLYKQLNENYILRVESEQKEKKAYIDGTNAADKLCNEKWEAKIKAKIEEYKKQIEKMEKDDIGRGFTLGKKWSDLKAKVEFGQSLLEKE